MEEVEHGLSSKDKYVEIVKSPALSSGWLILRNAWFSWTASKVRSDRVKGWIGGGRSIPRRARRERRVANSHRK